MPNPTTPLSNRTQPNGEKGGKRKKKRKEKKKKHGSSHPTGWEKWASPSLSRQKPRRPPRRYQKPVFLHFKNDGRPKGCPGLSPPPWNESGSKAPPPPLSRFFLSHFQGPPPCFCPCPPEKKKRIRGEKTPAKICLVDGVVWFFKM